MPGLSESSRRAERHRGLHREKGPKTRTGTACIGWRDCHSHETQAPSLTTASFSVLRSSFLYLGLLGVFFLAFSMDIQAAGNTAAISSNHGVAFFRSGRNGLQGFLHAKQVLQV